MKKLLCVVLILCMCVGLIGCKSSKYEDAMELYNQGQYTEAKAILESIGDYEDSLMIIEEITNIENYNNAVSLYNQGQYTKAKAILESIGDYEDSLMIIEEITNIENYNNAVSLFRDGKFEEARKLFTGLPNKEDVDVQRYLAAMDKLSEVIGVWSGDFEGDIDYSSYRDQLVSGTVKCTISPPYAITTSSADNYDWEVTAAVELTSGCYIMTGLGGLDYKTFSLKDKISLGHMSGKADEANAIVSQTDFLYNENLYEFMFFSDRGAFSVIWLNFKSSSKMEIVELPVGMDWNTMYSSETTRVTVDKQAP